ncbi:MAG TPA: DUF4391 domain-containing protein [Paludibacter sp.]|nr:DUF4391 domain-containing protein [Paludibacter sp.]
MIELPASTFFNKRVPKQRFYENLSVTSELKAIFVEQIDRIIWRNKIAPETLNLAKGEKVSELQVFELFLNQKGLDQRALQLMDREIPYHLLFLLRFEDQLQAVIAFKQQSLSKAGNFVVENYYQTDWHKANELKLRLEGLDMDAVYEGFIRQIAGERLEQPSPAAQTTRESLADAVARDKQRQSLGRKIDALQKKVHHEKQFNRQVALNAQLKRLKKQLEDLG